MKLQITGLLLLTLLWAVLHHSVSANDQVTQLKGPKNATNQYSGAVFGPIDSNDTLWRIASRYRQNKNLSVYQVMVAIYELNPEAFEEKNLNLLVDGATLKLPSERYIARIDKEKARLRAEQDEAEWARMENRPGSSLNNLKPPVPLVNQQDLTDTKSAIEKQLTEIDKQQARQFEQLRDQFAESINSVQALLDDNRKLYERIDRIDQELSAFQTQVNDEVQPKFDELLGLQRGLQDLIVEQQQANEKEKSSGLMKTLTSPMSLIIGTGVITLALMGGLIAWLLKRKSSPSVAEDSPVKAPEAAPVAEAPMADLSTVLDDDLDTAELSDDELFNDDDLLDDVLSTELEDSLDDELDSFADLNDDMLVPEEKDEFETGDGELDQDDLDSLFDEELDDDVDDTPPIQDDDDLLDEFDSSEPVTEEIEPRAEETTSDEELAALLEQPGIDLSEPEPQDNDDELDSIDLASDLLDMEDDVPEISIDDLLDEAKSDLETPDPLGLNGDNIDDELLGKLDEEITHQAQELDRITDNIINEIEQIELMGDLAGTLDDDEDAFDETLPADDPADDIDSSSKLQSYDTLTEDLDDLEDLDEIDVEDMANAADFDDPLSDELLAELQAELPEDEDWPQAGIAEDGEQSDDGEKDIDELVEDDLTKELLAELEAADQVDASDAQQTDDEELVQDSIASKSDESAVAEALDEIDDPLTDEILTELDSDFDESTKDVSVDELTDSLLEELEASGEGLQDNNDADTEQSDLLDEISEFESDISTTDESNDSGENTTDTLDESVDEGNESTAGDSASDDEQEHEVSADLNELLDEAAEPEQTQAEDSDPLLDALDDLENEVPNDESPIASETASGETQDDTDSDDLDELLDELAETEQTQAEDSDPLLDALDDLENEVPNDESPIDSETSSGETQDDTDSDDLDELLDELAETEQTQAEDSDPLLDALDDIENEVPNDELPLDSEMASGDTQDDADSDDFENDGVDDEPVANSEIESDEDSTLSAASDDDTHESDDDALSDALDEFDRQMIEDIPSFTSVAAQPSSDTAEDDDFDDSILEQALEDFDDVDSFSLEQEVDGVLPAQQSSREVEPEINELEDVPGLDDWLTGDSKSDDSAILDELDNSDFDELLGSIESEVDAPEEAQEALKLDNPDLDLEALFTEQDTDTPEPPAESVAEDFVDVETLMEESMSGGDEFEEEPELNLDVSLSEFSGVQDDDDVFDIDKDAGQSANLDLARVYIEMEDKEAAEELLQEVVDSGSAEQQEEAKALIASLRG